MLFNREKRIQYLGFDDIKFGAIAVFVLSIITCYVFSNSFNSNVEIDLGRIFQEWSIALMFTVVNWILM